jgi:fructose-bisphosphate aldolase, class I
MGGDLSAVAAALVAPGKGILAADEDMAITSARFAAAGIEQTGANRRAYREMLITTPALAAGISGVLLCAEAFSQRLADGTPFPVAARQRGMLPGIRVATGWQALPGRPGESVTEGLDSLPMRLRNYARRGAVFANWRAVLRIGPGMPSPIAIRANAQVLARYVLAAQHAGLVPVAEVDVLMNGMHSLAQCETVTSVVLVEVVTAMQDYGAAFDSVILRPSMTLPGSLSGEQASPAEVAEATMATLASMPASLAGVAFLSGRQRPEQATANLAALQSALLMWPVTFSFGRALTDPALAAWRGIAAAVPAGQRALASRTEINVAALQGRYEMEFEADPARAAEGLVRRGCPTRWRKPARLPPAAKGAGYLRLARLTR